MFIRNDYPKYPVADAGYGSFNNYLYCEEHGMEKFIFKYQTHVKGNKYSRTEEVYECENCEGCSYRSECTKKQEGNRTARLNRELTSFHHEVIINLESIHGALLCMNRSIQSEGTFGIIKWVITE